MGFSREYLELFCSMDKGSKVAAESNESVVFFEVFGFFKKRWFFRKKNLNFWKQTILVNLMSNATETVKFLKTVRIWVFARKDGFSEKTFKFLKMARGIKFPVKCN